jgi:putative transposase
MPNHIHGIIKLDYSIIGTCNDETSTETCHGEKSIGTCHGMSLFNDHQKQFNKFGYPVTGSVSVIINHFKSAVKRWCNKNGYELFLWQPRFYDHIINNKKDLIRIREYIKANPEEWKG